MKHYMIKNTFWTTVPEGKVISFVQSDTREFPDCTSLIKKTWGASHGRDPKITAKQDCLTLNQESLETHPTLILVTNRYVIWRIFSLLNDEVDFMQPCLE